MSDDQQHRPQREPTKYIALRETFMDQSGRVIWMQTGFKREYPEGDIALEGVGTTEYLGPISRFRGTGRASINPVDGSGRPMVDQNGQPAVVDLTLDFPIDAASLKEAFEKFDEAIQKAAEAEFKKIMEQDLQVRQKQQSRILRPGGGMGIGAPPPPGFSR